MKNPQRNRTPNLPLFILSGMLLCNCSPTEAPQPSPPDSDEVVRELLHNVAQNVIAPSYGTFAREALNLEQELGTWVNTPMDVEAKQTSQQAWKQAMVAWQKVETLQLGPAGSALRFEGGANLRDEIYSWPTTNPCRVDQEIVENEFTNANFFDVHLLNTYGLDALEYLLFNPSNDNQCRNLININSEGTWEELDDVAIETRRASYAHILSTQILLNALTLEQSWHSDSGPTYLHFTQPGVNDSIYDSELEALTALYHSLFYVELLVKDRKLAVPLEEANGCNDPTECAALVESQWAQFSKEEVIANLESFLAAFQGSNDPEQKAIGFDDLLEEHNAKPISEAIISGVTETLTQLQAIPNSLQEALLSDLAAVQSAYDSLQTSMTKFKTEFAEILDLEIPQEGAGDND